MTLPAFSPGGAGAHVACGELILLIRSRPAKCAFFGFSYPQTDRVLTACSCIVFPGGLPTTERQSSI